MHAHTLRLTPVTTPDYRLGDPRLPDRFWSKITVTTRGCWQWTAALDRHGYARFKLRRRNHLAHRLAFTTLGGTTRPGEELDHGCRNRACVNPAHLESVTHAENMARAVPFRRRARLEAVAA